MRPWWWKILNIWFAGNRIVKYTGATCEILGGAAFTILPNIASLMFRADADRATELLVLVLKPLVSAKQIDCTMCIASRHR